MSHPNGNVIQEKNRHCLGCIEQPQVPNFFEREGGDKDHCCCCTGIAFWEGNVAKEKEQGDITLSLFYTVDFRITIITSEYSTKVIAQFLTVKIAKERTLGNMT